MTIARISRGRCRLSRQDGFTMPAVMGAMLVVMLISAAAIAAASGDINLARYDQDDKNARAAAEAGINDYLGNLNADSTYWTKCTNVDSGAVSQKGATGSARKWKRIPGANTEYSIELIPAPGYDACDPANAPQSMLNGGNIKIRSTGRVRGRDNVRTANATLRRNGFLDFLYYTNYENQDRSYWKASEASKLNLTPAAGYPSVDNWLADKCERHYSGSGSTPGQGRGTDPTWQGSAENATTRWDVLMGTRGIGTRETDKASGQNTYSLASGPCGEIQFADDDVVNGPFHSNDDVNVCGDPEFGRVSGNDTVSISGEKYHNLCTGSGTPVFRPQLITRAAQLDPPPTNKSLQTFALAGYSFTGVTKIALDGDQMRVNGGAPKPLPPNGVVYVANGTCSASYDPMNAAARPAGCGIAEVSGTYSKDLTIAAESDIVVTGDVRRSGDAMMGLISNTFVRVAHKVTGQTGNISSGTCTTTADSPKNITIDSAILTLQGSFTVDNYWCGGALGNLTVNGAIAQQHRGVVGQGTDGYIKRYNYDERMPYRSPPFYLDPVQSSWRVLRQGEQSPAQRG